jgi:hypothetical protein
MGMPKVKPDNVVRHELVLGRSERELLDTLTTAYTVNRVVTPITSLLGSTTGLLLVASLGLAYLERFLPPDWYHRDESQLADWFETENIVIIIQSIFVIDPNFRIDRIPIIVSHLALSMICGGSSSMQNS